MQMSLRILILHLTKLTFPSSSEKKSLDILEQATTFKQNHFQVPLLWKTKSLTGKQISSCDFTLSKVN